MNANLLLLASFAFAALGIFYAALNQSNDLHKFYETATRFLQKVVHALVCVAALVAFIDFLKDMAA